MIWIVCGFTYVHAHDSLWNIKTSDYHDAYYGTAVGNGGIGILPWKEPFSVKQIVLNHVFDAEAPHEVSRLIRGINPFSMNVKMDGQVVDGTHISGWEQCILLKEALHQTRFVYANKLEVSYSIWALRSMPYAGLIQVKALTPVDLSVENGAEVSDEYLQPRVQRKSIQDYGLHLKLLRTSALTRLANFCV